MRATSPSSLLLSLTLHGFVVTVLVLFTWFTALRQRETPVIFELVAGPPTAPDELVAPALGNTTRPVRLEIPKVELVPSMPEPEPAAAARPEPTPVKPAPVEKAKAPPKPDNSMAKEVKQAQRMSYQEYLKKHPTPKQTAAKPRPAAKVPKIDTQGIAQGVKGGSTANTRGGGGGRALTREQQDKMDTYISFLLQELKRAHEPPSGVADHLEARVTFDITASGAILNPRITKSSGDKAFDESVIEAFLRMRSIGPTPNRRSDTWTVTFKLREEE